MEVGELALDRASWRAGRITALGGDETTAWLDCYAWYRRDPDGRETLIRHSGIERHQRTRVADLVVLTLTDWERMWMDAERDLWKLLYQSTAAGPGGDDGR